MNEIHPSAIIPIVVTWLVILSMFAMAFYFAFFAPTPKSPDDDTEPSSPGDAGS